MSSLVKTAVGSVLLVSLFLLVALIAVVSLAPPRWLAEQLEPPASDALDAQVTLSTVSPELLSLSPGVRVRNLTIAESNQNDPIIRLDRVRITLDPSRLIRGELAFDTVSVDGGTVRGSIDRQGQSSWEFLAPEPSGPSADPAKDEPAVIPAGIDASGEAGTSEAVTVEALDSANEAFELPALPNVRQLTISDVQLLYTDEQRALSADLVLRAEGSAVDRHHPTRVEANGTVNQVPASLDIETDSLVSLGVENAPLQFNVTAELGNVNATADGTLNEPTRLMGLKTDFRIEARGLRDVEQVAGIRLPSLPPMTASGTLVRQDDELVLQRFDGTLGDSDIEGDVRLNTATTPALVYATVYSRNLDLDDLGGLLGLPPDSDESVTPAQRRAAARAAGRVEQTGLVLPDTEFDLRPLLQAINGAIRYQALQVTSPVWPVDSMDVRVELTGPNADIEVKEIGLAGGAVTGNIAYDVADRPGRGKLELQVQQVDLKRVMQSIGIDDDSFGHIGGRIKFWVRGNTLAELAASADGGTYLLMTGGRLDALLVELAGVDLLESLILAVIPGKQRTDINCAYVDIQGRGGVANLANFVVDSTDTLLLGEGQIDLTDETLDLVFEPHPKDLSGLSAGTAVHVEGTLASPSVRPDAEGIVRAASAAALSALVSPVAALVPLLETGNEPDSASCQDLVETLASAD